MSDKNSLFKWYVVRAVSGQENKIKTYIENEITRVGMDSFIEQILVPSEKVVQIRNGKKVTKDKTYFPGYIMIKANLTGEVPHIIKSVTNVIGFLGETKGGDPIPLRQSEVNRMLGKVDELLSDTTQLEAYATGKRPTIKKLLKSEEKQKRVNRLHEDQGNQVDYIETKYGPGPDPTDFDDWPTPEYASGGRVPLGGGGWAFKLATKYRQSKDYKDYIEKLFLKFILGKLIP